MNNQPHTRCMSEAEMTHYNERMSYIINRLSSIDRTLEEIDARYFKVAEKTKLEIYKSVNRKIESFSDIENKINKELKYIVNETKKSYENEYKNFIANKIAESSNDIEKRIMEIYEESEKQLRSITLEYNRMIKIGKKRIDLLVHRIKTDSINIPADHHEKQLED